MDVEERLSLEAISAHTLIACEHLHRYEFAAKLCAGLRVVDVGCGTGYGSRILRETASAVLGVDNDAATIDTAQAAIGQPSDVAFETIGAQEFLQRDLRDDFDALVMFETLEHVADADAVLRELKRHADDGIKLVVSVPNSKAFEEENVFHLTDFGYDDTMDAFGVFEDVVIAFQYLAEGSLLHVDDGDVAGKVVLLDRAEPRDANHFLACVNFGGDAGVAAHAGARMQLNVAPLHNRHVRNLEKANRELWRINAQLGRERMGVADSAAAVRLLEMQRAMEATQRTMEAVWESPSWRLTKPLRAGKRLLREALQR